MILKQHHIITGSGSIFLFILILSGCAQKLYDRQSAAGQNSSATHTTVTAAGETHIVQDTTRTIDAPVEQSRNQVMDSSYLTTSLAWSSAVYRDGRLDHRIGNQPRIKTPVRVEYRDRWHTLHDTVIIRDTSWRAETVTVTKESTPLGLRIWSGIGKGILTICVLWLFAFKWLKK